MKPQPEFSPSMLRSFLYARALTREGFCRHQAAQRDLAGELMRLSGLALSDIRAAFAGRLTDAAKRARLWAVLGHFPADYGVTLDDDGGQRGQ